MTRQSQLESYGFVVVATATPGEGKSPSLTYFNDAK